MPSHKPSTDTPLALYVHWPFCVSKCPYCDFNSHVRETVDQAAWRDALLLDLAQEVAMLPGRKLASVFFGGGTPSLMPPETVAALLDAAERAWGFEPGIEITLEANPSSVEAARFTDLAAAGVNRVSLGLQALDNEVLAFLGRAHDVTEGLAALDTAQRAFERVSFDLIYARPDQRLADWHAELARALSFGTEHLSLYQLTIEPGTRFQTEALAGRLVLPDDDRAADLFELTRALTASAGMPAYEISNHARPGAHGRRTRVATQRRRKPENWIDAIGRNGHGIELEDPLAPRERAVEAMLMGLRLAEGIDLARVAALGERPIGELADLTAIDRLVAHGLLAHDGMHLGATDAGMPVLNAILGQIVRVAEEA